MRGRGAPSLGSRWRRAALIALGFAWGAILVLARRGVAVSDGVFDGWTIRVASAVKLTLGWIGLSVSQHAAFLYVPGGFAYVVGSGCSGIVPSAMLGAAIMVSPATMSARISGLVVAVPLVLLLNVVRLAHLFYIGVNDPRHFALAHEVLWEAALVAAVLAMWLCWWRWATGRISAARSH